MVRPAAIKSVIRSVLPPLIGGNLVIMANGLMASLTGLYLRQLDTPVWQVGAVLAGYFAGLAVGAVWCEHVIRRVGHIRAFAAYAGLLTALTLAHTVVVHPLMWFVLRAASGFAVAVLLTVTESWLNARAESRTRGLILAVYMASVQSSMAIGQLALFAVDISAVTAFVGPAVLYSLALVPVALTGELQPELPQTERFLLRELVRRAPLGVTGTFIAGMVAGTLYSLGAVFALGVGLEQDGIALFMFALLLGGLLLQLPLGRLSDRMDRRVVLAAAAGGLAVVALVLFASDLRGLGLLLPAIAAVSSLAFVLYPIAVAHINDWLDPSEIVPAAGLALLLYAGGATLGPIVASATMNLLGPAGLMLYVAVAATLLVLHALARTFRRAPAPEEERGQYQPVFVPTAAPVPTDLHQTGEYSPP